jgi:hypothetical protein
MRKNGILRQKNKKHVTITKPQRGPSYMAETLNMADAVNSFPLIPLSLFPLYIV